MTIIYILIAIIITTLNIVLLKKDKRSLYYLICVACFNIVFTIASIVARAYMAESFFDLISLNFLMWFAVCDMDEQKIVVFPFSIYAIIGVLASFFVEDTSFVLVIIYAAVVFGILYLFSKKSNESIGMADVYAISIITLYNAPHNTTSIVVVSLLLSLIAGLIVSIKKKTGTKTMIPYIPFLFVSSYLLELLYRI